MCDTRVRDEEELGQAGDRAARCDLGELLGPGWVESISSPSVPAMSTAAARAASCSVTQHTQRILDKQVR